MSALAALQRDFLATLQGGERGLLARLGGGRGVAPTRGLAVYVHAYSARLAEALASDHAMLATLLGDEAWETLVARYIAASPSRHPSLRYFGEGLPAFLHQDPHYASVPLVAELAQFERLLLATFDAADAPVAAWADLLSRPAAAWPSLRPAFAPSLRRFSSEHGAVDAWQALRRGAAPPTATGMRAEWVLWRDAAMVTRFRSLASSEAVLLDHLLLAGDFGQACERLQACHAAEDVPAFAVGQLRRWCAEGWIADWGG